MSITHAEVMPMPTLRGVLHNIEDPPGQGRRLKAPYIAMLAGESALIQNAGTGV